MRDEEEFLLKSDVRHDLAIRHVETEVLEHTSRAGACRGQRLNGGGGSSRRGRLFDN